MIYNFLRRDGKGSIIFSENLVPCRSYFVPCSGQGICDSNSFENIRKVSDRLFSLKGEVDFAFLPSGDVISIDSLDFFKKKIIMGESWESQGFGDLTYADFSFYRRDFSVKEGKKIKNSVGIYRKFFDISDLSRLYYLSFLSVGGSFEVHLNGKYVGFSDIGRGEFDISKFTCFGKNELVIKVKKWTKASYFDDNTTFSASGIKGDVLLSVRNQTSLLDFHFYTQKSESDIFGNLILTFAKSADADAFVQLKSGDRDVFSARKTIEDGNASFVIEGDFEFYSSDKPVLYDLYIKVLEKNSVTECVKTKIGFGNLEIIDGAATFSGEPIKIYGVNYNPFYAKDGKQLTTLEIKRDLKLIKSHNFNAVSPDYFVDPIVIALCQEIGLYVIQKIDVNTKAMRFSDKKRDLLIKNEKFAPLIMQKSQSVFERDKSYCNIVLYSFDDENGESKAISDAANYIKEANKYCIYKTYEKTDFDIATIFHPDINGLVEAINEVGANKPVFMSQYGISSGVGCASLREFMEVVDNTACSLGGCLTQFSDDVCKNIVANDDGVFNAEREPYAVANSNKYLCRSIFAFLPQYNIIELFNRSYFASTKNIVTTLEVISNGIAQSRFVIEGSIKPRNSRSFEVFLGHLAEDMYLNIYYKDKTTGELMAKEQLPLNSSLNTICVEPGTKPLSVTEIYKYLDIRFQGGFVRFDKETGTIVNYNLMGKDIIKPTPSRKEDQSFVPNIYRPFVRNIKTKQTKLNLQSCTFNCQHDPKEMLNSISVEVESIFNKNKKEMFIIQDKFLISSSGAIEVFSVVTPMRRGLEAMDCFGKQIRLHNSFGYITYYGRGQEENYIDMYQHSTVGLYTKTVDEQIQKYAKLQECGNHIDVHYAIATDKDGDGIALVAKKAPFQLRVSPYSDREIANAYLTGEEIAQSGVYVDVNAFVSGIGNTVNGKPLAQYMIKPTEYILHFDILPVYNKSKDVIS